MSVRPPFLRGMTGCVSEVLRHEPGGPRKWTRTPSGRCQRESDRLDRREGEAREEEEPRRQGREDRRCVGRDEGMRVRPRLPEATQWLRGEGCRDDPEEGPRRQAREEDPKRQDDVRSGEEAREYARRPGDPEPNDEGPFPDGRVRGDVRHLVDPEDPRHEEAQGYREDDGG